MEIHHFDWSKFNVYISDQKRALSKQTPLRQYLAEVNYASPTPVCLAVESRLISYIKDDPLVYRGRGLNDAWIIFW